MNDEGAVSERSGVAQLTQMSARIRKEKQPRRSTENAAPIVRDKRRADGAIEARPLLPVSRGSITRPAAAMEAIMGGVRALEAPDILPLTAGATPFGHH